MHLETGAARVSPIPTGQNVARQAKVVVWCMAGFPCPAASAGRVLIVVNAQPAIFRAAFPCPELRGADGSADVQ